MATPNLDLDIGTIKQRALRRQEAGIKTRGPANFGPPVPAPRTPASRVRRARAETAVEAHHRAMIERELDLIDRHAAHLTALAATDDRSYRHQEAVAELGRLRTLRREVEYDLHRPILHDREGRPLTDRDYALLRLRTKEIADAEGFAAGRAAAEGDHRRAARHRHDALRARHLSEYEARWRPSLRGFSYPG